MTYQQTTDYLFSKLPVYQNIGGKAYKANLDNIKALCSELKHPQESIKTIHIAGTNGKGSVAHFLASIFQEQGYKTGLFTSPHLFDFRERIKVDGQMISESAVVEFTSKLKPYIESEQPSFFEVTTAMAFWYFEQQKTDIAIIETGLGGRLDSTNIITPEISVITNIGLDHTQFLGNTLREIAFEKGGIIKNEIPVVIGEHQEETYNVFQEIAQLKKAPIYLADEIGEDYIKISPLKGVYQEKNLATVLSALDVLEKEMGYAFDEKNMKSGIERVVQNTGLRGRWEVIQTSPRVIVDVGHNKEAFLYISEMLKKEQYKQLHVVLGMVADKNHDEVLELLPDKADYYFTQPNIERALNAESLKTKADNHGLKGDVFSSAEEAYRQALQAATAEDLVFVGGSVFTVGEVLGGVSA